MSVYFARNGDLIKIGCSREPEMRVYGLNRTRPRKSEPLRLIGYIDGDFDTEAAWHRRFSHLAVDGEWFRSEPILLEAIAVALGNQPMPTRHDDTTDGPVRSYTALEVAAALHRELKWVYRHADELGAVRIGRAVIFPRHRIDAIAGERAA